MKATAIENVFSELIDRLSRMTVAQRKAVAEQSNVVPQTLWNWCWGSTINPHLNTIVRVSRALGYEVALVQKPQKLKKVS